MKKVRFEYSQIGYVGQDNPSQSQHFNRAVSIIRDFATIQGPLEVIGAPEVVSGVSSPFKTRQRGHVRYSLKRLTSVHQNL